MKLIASLLAAAVLAAAHVAPALSQEQAGEWRHGAAIFGDLKYAPGWTHYDHVNPDAPKGGQLNEDAFGSYDSFNPFVVRGRPAAGLSYSGGLLYDSLMDQSVDQPSASYGLVAEAFRHPPDFSSATYRINPAARFHDGEPIKPEDVIWSLEALKANYPLYTDYYKNVVKAEKTGEREVTFTFDVKGNRELPVILGDLPVLPKHWWEGTDAKGAKRNIADPVSEPPLGSGPYRIASFDMGKTVTWERVDDYWAAGLPVRKGRFNFDRIVYTYFLDQNTLWEAFKKGGIADTRAENVSKQWATEYDFPAFKRGDVTRNAFPTDSPEPFQGYFLNTRIAKFSDWRVRKALNLLFDFESMNRTLFFDLYTRTDSYFEGGELQAGPEKPDGRMLEILEEYRGKVPDAVFEPFPMPSYAAAADTRKNQREALKLFTEAGYTFRNGQMLDPQGRQFEIEILGSSPTDERVGIPTIENLKKLGIKADLRVVDTAQYKARLDAFDFEMTMSVTAQSLSPGNEQREYWSSAAADRPGARNYAGIKDPVVDELVERIIHAHDRDELVALTRALDRVLMTGWYTIPMWHNPELWFAWWTRLKSPPTHPVYSGIDLYAWWIE